MSKDEPKEDLAGNRLTLVPALGVYSAEKDSTQIRGRVGVTASNITCAPKETDTEPSLGTWSTTGAALELLMGASDCGPRSGRTSEYKDKVVASGKHKMMVSDSALLGALEGQSVWGDSGPKTGRLLVWKWSFDDIDEIAVGRIKKMFVMWDVDLLIQSRDPKAALRFSGLGEDAHIFNAYDAHAKTAKHDGSNLLGFAKTLSEAIARHRGCEVNHSTGGTKDVEHSFTFTSIRT